MKKIFFLFVFATLAFTSNAQVLDPTTSKLRYTDAEIVKLRNYVKNLEQKVAPYIAAHPNNKFVNIVENSAEEKMFIQLLASDSMNQYNDGQVIKLARYIKYLESLDSLVGVEQIALAKARQRAIDSIAAEKAKQVEKSLEPFLGQVYFDFDKSSLKQESYKPLNEALEILKNNPEMTFQLEGHTDSFGEDEYNLSLSKARAKTVRDYLVSKGIKANRISSEGFGESKPVATNETEEGRAKNRRVEIKAKKK